VKVTLFVPVRNEITGIRQIMPKIRREWVDEILVVDGGSTDGTREYFQENGYKVLPQKSRGIGGAYWECVDAAEGEAIIAFSPDGNSLPEAIPTLAAKMREGWDMVVASRYLQGAKSEDDDPVTAAGNWMFTKLANVLFGASYTDSLVMLRAFRKDLPARLSMARSDRPIFEYLLSIGCAKRGLKVLEIPADEPARIGDVRKMSPLYNGSMLLLAALREYFRP